MQYDMPLAQMDTLGRIGGRFLLTRWADASTIRFRLAGRTADRRITFPARGTRWTANVVGLVRCALKDGSTGRTGMGATGGTAALAVRGGLAAAAVGRAFSRVAIGLTAVAVGKLGQRSATVATGAVTAGLRIGRVRKAFASLLDL